MTLFHHLTMRAVSFLVLGVIAIPLAQNTISVAEKLDAYIAADCPTTASLCH